MQVKCKSSAIEFIRIAEAQPSLAVELVFDGKVTANIRAKTSPTCCDGVGEMRQTASKPQNPVASKIKFGGFKCFSYLCIRSNKVFDLTN